MTQTTITEPTLLTLGGRVLCVRCSAFSKRTKLQCLAPAIKGKTKCRTHGGLSCGPRTDAGRKKCAEVKTIHGRETRQLRTERALASAKLAVLEAIGHDLGFLEGRRTPGPRPHKMGDVLPELQSTLQASLLKKKS